jgi:hypothetical protein
MTTATDTNYDWNTSVTDSTSDGEAHELDALDVAIVPDKPAPHPKAIQWVEDAYQTEGSHGEMNVTDEAQYERVRGYLRDAAAHLGYTVTVKPRKDKKDKVTGLTYTVGQRRGRKTD